MNLNFVGSRSARRSPVRCSPIRSRSRSLSPRPVQRRGFWPACSQRRFTNQWPRSRRRSEKRDPASVGRDQPTRCRLLISRIAPGLDTLGPCSFCRESATHVARVEGHEFLSWRRQVADTLEVRASRRTTRELATKPSRCRSRCVSSVFGLFGLAATGASDTTTTSSPALAALTACLACLSARSRQNAAMRRFWMFLALALGAWTLARVIWAV